MTDSAPSTLKVRLCPALSCSARLGVGKSFCSHHWSMVAPGDRSRIVNTIAQQPGDSDWTLRTRSRSHRRAVSRAVLTVARRERLELPDINELVIRSAIADAMMGRPQPFELFEPLGQS